MLLEVYPCAGMNSTVEPHFIQKRFLFPVTRPTQFWLPEANFFFYCMNLINKLIVSESVLTVLYARL